MNPQKLLSNLKDSSNQYAPYCYTVEQREIWRQGFIVALEAVGKALKGCHLNDTGKDLNLEELERNLDQALDKETRESLSGWLAK